MKKLYPFVRLPFLPIVLAPFILLSPALFARKALFWGTPFLQFVPWWHWAWETLRAGHLPLWNPLVGMGSPLVANYQSGLFYPPNWLYFILAAFGGLPALAWGQALLVALHLAWAGAGMALLARRLGLSLLAQTVSGLAFGLSGYLVARAGFLSINSAAAWTPWIMLAVMGDWGERPGIFRGPEARRMILGAGLCLALQLLAGHAQTVWYTLLLAGMWAGFWGWQSAVRGNNPGQSDRRARLADGMRGIFQAWKRFGLALALASGLAAVQLLPTVEYLLQSQRASEVNYELAMTYSFWPWRILGLLTPGLFGSPVQGDYWGYGNFWEDALYVGILPLLLAVAVLVKRKRSVRANGEPAERVSRPTYNSLVWFLFALSLIALLLALGKNTPVYPWLYRHVPTFDMFQAPARYLLWLEVALALLAGLGAESWRRPEKRALYWTRLGTAGAFAVSLGAGLAWFFMGEVSPSFIRATALAGVWGLGSGVLSLLAPQRCEAQAEKAGIKRAVWSWAVALFVAADLLVAGWGLNPVVDQELYRSPSPTAEAVRKLSNGGRLYLPEEDERELKFERFLRFDSFDPGESWMNLRAVLLPNANLLDRLPSANNFDPLLPGRYARWMGQLAEATPDLQNRMLDLMAVGLVEKVDPRQIYGVRFEPVEPPAENEDRRGAGGRVRWTPCARAARDERDAWMQVIGGSVDFRKEVILEAAEDPSTASCQPDAGYAEIRLAGAQAGGIENPNRVAIQVKAGSPGWLVLSDVWYPGWQAWVDGKPVTVHRANYLFRAVPVDAGTHEVILAYRPIPFWLGTIISLLTLAGAGWLVLRERRKADVRIAMDFHRATAGKPANE